MLTRCLLKFIPSRCQSLLCLCPFNRGFSLSALEILLGAFFFAHPLVVLPCLLFLLLPLQFILVCKSEFSEAKLEVGVRDLGVDNLSEYVNPLEGLLDSFNHAGYVVPGDSCNQIGRAHV